MKIMFAVGLLVISGLTLFCWRFGGLGIRPAQEPVVALTVLSQSSEPCIPSDVASEEFMKRQRRDILGYEKEVPLTEAVQIFNQEMLCSPLFNSYPPLTEDEVIAAIVTNADYDFDKPSMKRRLEALTQIAINRRLPKGSLLIFEGKSKWMYSPLNPEGSVSADGIKISLFLDLDEKGLDAGTPSPDKVLVIRKTFSGYRKESK